MAVCLIARRRQDVQIERTITLASFVLAKVRLAKKQQWSFLRLLPLLGFCGMVQRSMRPGKTGVLAMVTVTICDSVLS